MNDPLVSVILCTFNQRAFLSQAIESVRAQTYGKVELLVVDNGSTDGSEDVLGPFAERHELQLIAHSVNGRLSQRLNEAVRRCHGEYVSILFGDDYYLPEKIATQVSRFRSAPGVGVVYSPGYRLYERTGRLELSPTLRSSGRIIGELLANYGKASISPIAPLVRRECFEENPFDESIRLIVDSVYLFIALTYQFSFVDTPLVVMRDHGENSGWAYRQNFEDALIVFDHLQQKGAFPQHLRSQIVEINATQARNLAWKIARFSDDGGEARRYLLRAVGWRAGSAIHPRSVGAFVLSILPTWIRRRISDAASRVKGQRPELIYREMYH